MGKARRNIAVLIKIRLAFSGLSLKASERRNKSNSLQYTWNRSEGVCTTGEACNSDVLYLHADGSVTRGLITGGGWVGISGSLRYLN